MRSMYAEYVKERTGDDVIETEKGFATYRFMEPKTVYLIDIYVKPEFRIKGVASDIADMVMELAKIQGCTKMIGSVVPSANNSTISLRALLGYGMTLKSCTNDFIIFEKEFA